MNTNPYRDVTAEQKIADLEAALREAQDDLEEATKENTCLRRNRLGPFLENVSNGEEKLRALLRSQETWSRLSLWCDLSDIKLRLSGDEKGGMAGWPKFASSHSGHDVAVRNEYGVFSGECGAPVRCPSCSCHHACVLPSKHAGEHEMKRGVR